MCICVYQYDYIYIYIYSCYKGCEQLQKKKGKLLDCLMDFNKGETGIVIKDISTLSGLSQEVENIYIYIYCNLYL